MQEGRCVMARSAEDKPAAVPVATTTAKQAGSCRARWAWSEPTIWTERMLTALEQGVKGGKWSSALAECFLCQPGPVQSHASPPVGASVLLMSTDWRAGCGRSASPVRREGGPMRSVLPTPIAERVEWLQYICCRPPGTFETTSQASLAGCESWANAGNFYLD